MSPDRPPRDGRMAFVRSPDGISVELLQRGEYARAVAEYREFVRAAQGDNRTLAPALKDLGRAQAIERAIRKEDSEFTSTRWSDAVSSGGSPRTWGGARMMGITCVTSTTALTGGVGAGSAS